MSSSGEVFGLVFCYSRRGCSRERTAQTETTIATGIFAPSPSIVVGHEVVVAVAVVLVVGRVVAARDR